MAGRLQAITDTPTTALWGGCFLKLGLLYQVNHVSDTKTVRSELVEEWVSVMVRQAHHERKLDQVSSSVGILKIGVICKVRNTHHLRFGLFVVRITHLTPKNYTQKNELVAFLKCFNDTIAILSPFPNQPLTPCTPPILPPYPLPP